MQRHGKQNPFSLPARFGLEMQAASRALCPCVPGLHPTPRAVQVSRAGVKTRPSSPANSVLPLCASGWIPPHDQRFKDEASFEIIGELLAEGWVKSVREWQKRNGQPPRYQQQNR